MFNLVNLTLSMQARYLPQSRVPTTLMWCYSDGSTSIQRRSTSVRVGRDFIRSQGVALASDSWHRSIFHVKRFEK